MNKLQNKHNDLLYFFNQCCFFTTHQFMFNSNKFNEIKDFLKKTNNSAKIIAISKNHPLESVLEAINSGVYIFGENRVQEAQEKFQKIKQKIQI